MNTILFRSLVLFTVLVVISSQLTAAKNLSSKREAYDVDQGESINTMTSLHDRMILRFIDALLDEALTSGAPDHQVDDLKRKRSGLRKCFFHAINCW